MLSACYLKIMERSTYLKLEIDRYRRDVADQSVFENRVAGQLVKGLIDSLDNVSKELKRLASPTAVGRLSRDRKTGMFELVDNSGQKLGCPISQGDPLEVLGDRGEWFFGKVDFITKNDALAYCLINKELGNPLLFEGMVCRVRWEA